MKLNKVAEQLQQAYKFMIEGRKPPVTKSTQPTPTIVTKPEPIPLSKLSAPEQLPEHIRHLVVLTAKKTEYRPVRLLSDAEKTQVDEVLKVNLGMIRKEYDQGR